MFRLGEPVGVAGEPQQPLAITHDHAPAHGPDSLILFELVQCVGHAATADAEHEPELLVRHADVVLAYSVVVEKNPSRHPPFNRMRERRNDRLGHLGHDHVDETEQDGSDRGTFGEYPVQRCGRQPHRRAVFGPYHHVMRPAPVAEQQLPTDKPLIPEQRDRVAAVTLKRVKYRGDLGQREADAVSRIAGARNHVAVVERHQFQMRRKGGTVSVVQRRNSAFASHGSAFGLCVPSAVEARSSMPPPILPNLTAQTLGSTFVPKR